MKFTLNQVNLFRGQDDQFIVALIDDEGNPINISGATALSLFLKKSDDGLLEKTPFTGMTVGITSQIWFYVFNINRNEANELAIGPKQSIELKVTMGSGAIRYIVLKNCLSVSEIPF